MVAGGPRAGRVNITMKKTQQSQKSCNKHSCPQHSLVFNSTCRSISVKAELKCTLKLQEKKKSPHINQQVFCKIINLKESYKIRGP